MCALWNRLGDCSINNKTINVTIDGITLNYTFTKNYLLSKDSEESILSDVNSVITHATLKKYSNPNSYENINVTNKRRVIVKSPNGVVAGDCLTGSGFLCGANVANDNIQYIALEDGAPNESVMCWSANVVPLHNLGFEDGEYGVDSNGHLSISATTKIGTIGSNILFRNN